MNAHDLQVFTNCAAWLMREGEKARHLPLWKAGPIIRELKLRENQMIKDYRKLKKEKK